MLYSIEHAPSMISLKCRECPIASHQGSQAMRQEQHSKSTAWHASGNRLSCTRPSCTRPAGPASLAKRHLVLSTQLQLHAHLCLYANFLNRFLVSQLFGPISGKSARLHVLERLDVPFKRIRFLLSQTRSNIFRIGSQKEGVVSHLLNVFATVFSAC